MSRSMSRVLPLPQDTSSERKQALERLRAAVPPGASMVTGFRGASGNDDYERIYGPQRHRHVDVHKDNILERHQLPDPNPDEVVLYVRGDVTPQKTKPSDLLVGPVLTQLPNLAVVALCWTAATRSPKRCLVHEWLDREWPFEPRG